VTRIPARIRNQVRQRANGRCEYCGLLDSLARLSHQVDHVVPPRHGGSDELINLAWACFRCNNGKGTDIGTVDITTNQRVWLFNPREQKWDEHLELEVTGLIIGKSSEGRATARLLDMNVETEVEARRLLIENNLW
jgi:hypothetical protein